MRKCMRKKVSQGCKGTYFVRKYSNLSLKYVKSIPQGKLWNCRALENSHSLGLGTPCIAKRYRRKVERCWGVYLCVTLWMENSFLFLCPQTSLKAPWGGPGGKTCRISGFEGQKSFYEQLYTSNIPIASEKMTMCCWSIHTFLNCAGWPRKKPVLDDTIVQKVCFAVTQKEDWVKFFRTTSFALSTSSGAPRPHQLQWLQVHLSSGSSGFSCH